jgi:hypothetical protein
MKSLTLKIIKHDGMFFHVKIGDFSTISGMTKNEIQEAAEKYKENFKLIFNNKAIENKFNRYQESLELD